MPHERINCNLTTLNSSHMFLIACVQFDVFSTTLRNNFVSSDSSSSIIDLTDASLFFQKLNSKWIVSRS